MSNKQFPNCPRCYYPADMRFDKYCRNCGLPLDKEEVEEKKPDDSKEDDYTLN